MAPPLLTPTSPIGETMLIRQLSSSRATRSPAPTCDSQCVQRYHDFKKFLRIPKEIFL